VLSQKIPEVVNLIIPKNKLFKTFVKHNRTTTSFYGESEELILLSELSGAGIMVMKLRAVDH